MEAELTKLQVLQMYHEACGLDRLLPLSPSAVERDWDLFFERLEQRFLCAKVPDMHKEALTRRLLRGVVLATWSEYASKDPKMNYETLRDKTIKKFFPLPTEFTRLVGMMSTATPLAEAKVEGEGSNSAQMPSGRGRRTFTVVGVMAQVHMHRARLMRVKARHMEVEMPSEDQFIIYAIKLMRPALAAEAEKMTEHRETVDAFMQSLADINSKLFGEGSTESRSRAGRGFGRRRRGRSSGGRGHRTETTEAAAAQA